MIRESSSEHYLDLRGTPCPLNFIRSSLAIEELEQNQSLHIDLDKGEPEMMVIPGLKNAGHHVEIICEDLSWLRVKVTCGDV